MRQTPHLQPKTSPVAASKKDVNAAVKAATTPSAKAPVAAAAAKPAPPANQAVTEDEVMRVLKSTGPIKSTDLVAKFRSRLRSPEVSSSLRMRYVIILHWGLFRYISTHYCKGVRVR